MLARVRIPGLAAVARLAAVAALAVGAGLSLGCSGEAPETASLSVAPVADASAAPPSGAERTQRPLPAFEGPTLDGQSFAASSWIGRRFVVFVFNPEVPEAPIVARALRDVAQLRRQHNFELVGVGTGSTRSRVRAFVEELGLDFPVVDDSSAAIAVRLGIRVPVAILGVDPEGYLSFGLGGFTTDGPDPARAVEVQLREALRLPGQAGAEPVAGERLRAPELRGVDIASGKPVDLAALRGSPVVVIFFLHTCPHCHHAMLFLKEQLPRIPEASRPRLVGVSVSDRGYVVQQKLTEDGLAFFPVVTDPDQKIRNDWGVLAGIPDIFLVDAEGFLQARVQGWRDDREPPLLRMQLARLAGQPVPMLLHQTGYSGNEFCSVCHAVQDETWRLTRHAAAYDTLFRHGADRDGECVGCHVVGFGEPGGFRLDAPSAEFENVGCESCHGRGGPHLSPGAVVNHDYQKTCLSCHDQKHSLGFDYARFLPRVSHAANAEIARLSPEEKRKRLAHQGRPGDLLPTNARYVGSEACRDCHATEFETWSQGPHARALATLRAKGKQDQADCLRCHTTAFGREGGFPAAGRPEAHPDLARVGCESCHGPGGAHVADGARRIGSIVSLGDKCDSCVILQICGTCHDDANDAGFEFEVLQKIEAIRHGTIEPGTGQPKARRAEGEPQQRRVEPLRGDSG